ncbi:MAG: DNA replication complex GINS family protein [Candidatus Aenigmarchaeota archaeon]|nr:DNA replication complex GINS family protein [Candidatus Aenigmarchaeota archaeon]
MLTFDKIRDIERAEKENKKLQKLPEDLMEKIREYITRKESISKKMTSDIIEIENAKNTIKRLFETRERKIIEAVLLYVRSGIPPENLTSDEDRLFTSCSELFKKFREGIFDDLKKEGAVKKEGIKMYKVKKAMPKFIGPDMNAYELHENQVLNIPKPLSDLLIKEGIIEEIADDNTKNTE